MSEILAQPGRGAGHRPARLRLPAGLGLARDGLARSEGGAVQDAGGGAERRSRRGVGQVRDAARAAETNRTIEDADGHLAHAGELARAARQHHAGAGLDGRIGRLQALASAKLRREPLDPAANPVAKAAAWLRENL